MYLLHIVYGGYEDCEEVRTFDTFSDVEDYVSQLDFEDTFGVCVLDCYECSGCVDLLKKMRKEKA